MFRINLSLLVLCSLLATSAFGQSAEVNLSKWAHQLTGNYQSSGRPGIVLQPGASGSFVWGIPSGGASDSFNVQFNRTPTYSGGTPGFVNSALSAATTTLSGQTAYEWTGLFQMDNFGTSADASENLALYAKSTKESTGKTWATAFELDDKSTDPTVTSVTTEVDLWANTTDANGNRVILDLVGGRIGGIGSTPTITHGLRIGPANGNSANASFTNGITVQGAITTLLNLTGGVAASGSAVTDSGTHSYGLNLGGTYSAGFLYARDDSPLIWNSGQTITQKWKSADSCVEVLNSSTAITYTCTAGGSGGFGIGVKPAVSLDVNTGSATTIRATDGTIDIRVKAATGASGGQLGTFSNHDVMLMTNSAENARFYAGGGLHIGSFQSSAGYQLDVNGTSRFQSTISLPVTTVASLPTCNTGAKGAVYAVSDASAPTYNATVSGGGAVSIPVYCNGTNWTAH